MITHPISFLCHDITYNLLSKKLNKKIKGSVEYTILYNILYEKLKYNNGIYADYIYKKIKNKIEGTNKRRKFYYIIEKLTKLKLIEKSKKDGLVYLTLHSSLEHIILNSIKVKQNSNLRYAKRLLKYMTEFNLKPKDIRKQALLWAKDKKQLDSFERETLLFTFLQYLKKIEEKIILLKKGDSKILKIEYKTRFNNEARVFNRIEELEKAFKKAYEKYDRAVFLTLTIDPNKHKNIYSAAKKEVTAWNKFLSYIKKKLKNFSYIKVYEFTKKGVLHNHIILFGVKYLLNYKKISYLWEKYGMGRIIYIYGLKKDEINKKWTWARKKPKKCKEKNIEDYLKKYLKKAFYEVDELSLYWLNNKRFWTCSKNLREETKKRIKKGWEYIGVFNKEIIEEYEDNEILNILDTVEKINYGIIYNWI